MHMWTCGHVHIYIYICAYMTLVFCSADTAAFTVVPFVFAKVVPFLKADTVVCHDYGIMSVTFVESRQLCVCNNSNCFFS